MQNIENDINVLTTDLSKWDLTDRQIKQFYFSQINKDVVSKMIDVNSIIISGNLEKAKLLLKEFEKEYSEYTDYIPEYRRAHMMIRTKEVLKQQ
jgi:hypothetical protein